MLNQSGICPVPERINTDCANIFISVNYFPLNTEVKMHKTSSGQNFLSCKISFEGSYLNINFFFEVLIAPDRYVYIYFTNTPPNYTAAS